MTKDDHVCVVGGTKGLGRVVVQHFLDRGCRVTAVSRNPPVAGTVSKGLCHIAADLETLADAGDIVQRALGIGGPLRYLAFCQRYRGNGDPWQGEIQVGLTATRLLIEGFAENFCADGDRAIGVVSSVYAEAVGGSQPVGYHVVKAGLNQMVRYFAWTLGKKGLRLNAVMPLTYVKPESRAFYEGNTKLQRLYKDFVPLGRLGDAEDSANLVDFLCSDKAAFINGQCILVDGGVSVMWPEELARSGSGV
jgi:NAD(P)-dependent dehydrogenase (short-subunit alcohol dehydrogenase family)